MKMMATDKLETPMPSDYILHLATTTQQYFSRCHEFPILLTTLGILLTSRT